MTQHDVGGSVPAIELPLRVTLQQSTEEDIA
jgi:hypothetical protein